MTGVELVRTDVAPGPGCGGCDAKGGLSGLLGALLVLVALRRRLA